MLQRIKSDYGEITVEDTNLHGEPVRLYRHDGAFSSGTFLSENRKYDLLFEYQKKYNIVFDYYPVQNALMIGGAAYQYPKYYISHFSGRMDVVEIDPKAEEIARQWFFLEDLFEEYELRENHRLRCITGDARVFLEETDRLYDVIFNDAFLGSTPVRRMATVEAVQSIKTHLIPEGFYLSNIIGSLTGSESGFMRSVIATAKKVFRYVYVLYCEPEYRTGAETSNYIILATDRNIVMKNSIHYHLSNYEVILKDDRRLL